MPKSLQCCILMFATLPLQLDVGVFFLDYELP